LPRPAPEARQIVAHGETVGLVRQKPQAPAGATENNRAKWFCSAAPAGACLVGCDLPTVLPWAIIARRSATSKMPRQFRAHFSSDSSVFNPIHSGSGWRRIF